MKKRYIIQGFTKEGAEFYKVINFRFLIVFYALLGNNIKTLQEIDKEGLYI